MSALLWDDNADMSDASLINTLWDEEEEDDEVDEVGMSDMGRVQHANVDITATMWSSSRRATRSAQDSMYDKDDTNERCEERMIGICVYVVWTREETEDD